MTEIVRVKVEGRWYTVEVGDLTERPVRAVVDGHVVEVDVGERVEERSSDSRQRTQRVSSRESIAPSRPVGTARDETPAAQPKQAAVVPAPAVERPAGAVVDSPPDPSKVFAAPMPGTILSIEVGPGDQVVTGDTVCVLEAMKMQQHLRADWSGVVKAVLVAVGQQVMDGTPIVELE